MQSRNTTLDDLAVIIGFTATIRFSIWFGSRSHNVYVPHVASEEHDIAKLIGLPAMRRLVEEFGGEHLSVPSLHAAYVDKRNATIRDMLMAGVSPREIAGETGLTERRVQQLRREMESLGLLPMIFSRDDEKSQ